MDLFVKFDHPFEQEIEMPRTDKEGKVLQLPECFSSFAQMDSMIAKLNSEDFKPGATVAWMSDPHHDRPELWTLIVDVDPERVVNGHWQQRHSINYRAPIKSQTLFYRFCPGWSVSDGGAGAC